MKAKTGIAVVGATGEVGRALIALLEDAEWAERLVPVASAASEEETLMFRGRPLLVESLDAVDFSDIAMAVFAVPAAVAAKVIPVARAAGCWVIDHSSFSRDQDVPQILAADALPDDDWLACPSPLAAVLAPLFRVLKPLANLTSADLVVLEPVSSQGQEGIKELAGQTGELLNARGIEPAVYPAQIAFNTLPLAAASDNEALMDALELLADVRVPVSLSAIKVPVFYGFSVSVSLRTETVLTPAALRQAALKAGFLFPETEAGQQVATPVTDASGQNGHYLCRLEALPAPLQGIRLWLVADNVRQGAAQHSLYILEKWSKRL